MYNTLQLQYTQLKYFWDYYDKISVVNKTNYKNNRNYIFIISISIICVEDILFLTKYGRKNLKYIFGL